MDDIHIWMFENKLKLNPGKTEFIVFGSMDKYKWLKDSFPVNILGNCLPPKDVVRNLGVLFDSRFSFTNHVNSVIKSCFANFRDLHRIHCFLSYDVSVMGANGLVSSCPPRISQGFKISKIIWHALSLVHLDFRCFHRLAGPHTALARWRIILPSCLDNLTS